MPYLTTQVGAEDWAPFLLDGLRREAVVLASGARVITTNGRSLHVPRTSDATPTWLAELEEIPADAANASELELVPKKVGVLTLASTEAVGDAAVDLLDSIGDTLVSAVAREVDRALIDGLGTTASKQPRGLLRTTGLPTQTGAVDYAGLITAAGKVRAAGGRPSVAFIAPADHTTLALAADGENRPLLQGTADAAVEVIGGMRLYPTAAVPAGKAIVADATQILVALRDDPTVAISADAAFGADALAVRVTARVDIGIDDTDGLVVISPA